MDAKTCFVFVTIQRGLSVTDLAPILTAFETKDVNRCAHAYSGEKFPNFCAKNFTGPKTAKILSTFEGVFVIRLQLKRHNFEQ